MTHPPGRPYGTPRYTTQRSPIPTPVNGLGGTPGKDQGPRIHSLYTPGMKSPPQADVLCDHIGPWCARCLGYLSYCDIGAYHPYSWIPSVDERRLQVDLGKVLGWAVPVHQGGCLSDEVVDTNATAATIPLDLFFRYETDELNKWANITFRTGNLNVNMAIRLALSHRYFDEGLDEYAAIELAKATISNGGSIQGGVIRPFLQSHMPNVIYKMTYPRIQVLMAEGNLLRNLGYPDYAEKRYGQALWIIDKKIRVRNPKARAIDAIGRRLATVAEHVSSKDAEKLIRNAKDHNEPYGRLTALQIDGYNNLRNNEYGQAIESFLAMFDQQRGAIVSWWHKMAGWLGLGATLYTNNPREFEQALDCCLKAEYVSAMLGLRVDVTRGISEQLLSPQALLSPSAVVRKIGEEGDVAKEDMGEIRHIALIESGLQDDLFAELRAPLGIDQVGQYGYF